VQVSDLELHPRLQPQLIVTKYFYFGGQRVAMRRNGVLQYILGDHLGTTSLVLDDQGNRIAESRHLPYGEERWSWVDGGGDFPTDYRFTGQREQASVGLYHMGARFYDVALGRWISADTIVPEPGNPQDLNRYSYVRGNPLKFSDPSGHLAEGDDNSGDVDLTLELLILGEEDFYWYLNNTNGQWEVIAFGVGGLVLVGGGGVVVVDAGVPLAEAIGAEKLVEGLISAGGYVVGALATGEEIDLKDLGLAFAAGAGVPGGSGTGWKKILTGAGWGMVSNASQSAASQGIDLATGEQIDFSVSDLTVNAALGGIGGVVGDPLGEHAEPLVENASRGLFRGVSSWVKVGVDAAFSWIGNQLQVWLNVSN
jgi:RHS repeat-associated protein